MKLKKSSFTLIEVIMAIGAFMVGTMPLLGLLTATSTVNYDNRKQAMISLLASRKMDDLKILGWTQMFAADAQNNTAKDAFENIMKCDLVEDDEFPELSYVIEKLREGANLQIRYTAIARLGIAVNDKSAKLNNSQGVWASYGVPNGGNLSGITLTQAQTQRYKNGGAFCVVSDNSANDAIFCFTSASSTQINGITHFYPSHAAMCGKIIFLEQVFTIPINQRNKLYDFSNLNQL